MQAERKAAQQKAEEEAKLLARAAFAKGETYDPAPDFPAAQGFVFSKSQLAEIISREDRLTEARTWQRDNFKPQSRPEKPQYKVQAA